MTDISGWAHVAAGAAAVGAGIVNAVAGGGTLISFPVLTAIGVPAVRANATNTVSLCPGYIGGTYAAAQAISTGLQRGLRPLLVAAIVGGLSRLDPADRQQRGGLPADRAVPHPGGMRAAGGAGPAAQLVAVERASRRLARGPRAGGGDGSPSVYGGYFGAGLGIMLMAVLGLFSELPFNRLNAVKQLLSFLVNISAALFLVFSGKVEWSLVLVMAPASLLGGHFGGRVASSLPPKKMRFAVIVFGVVVAIVYLVK